MGSMKTPGVYIVEKVHFRVRQLKWLRLYLLLSGIPKWL